jgi:hypothetical protein
MEQHDRSKPMAIGCYARQTLVVLAHSYDHLPVEYVRGLSKCQVIGNSLEVTAGFSLLHVDCLEEESLPSHVHSHDSHFPVARCNFYLPDLKAAALVQVSQQAASKLDILHEMTINRGQSFLFAFDPQFAFHAMENTSVQGRRLEIQVGSEAQFYQVALTTRVVEHKCIRQHLEQSFSGFFISVLRPPQFLLFGWIAHQLLNTLVLFLQLFRGEGLVVNRQESTQITVLCLNDSADLFFA